MSRVLNKGGYMNKQLHIHNMVVEILEESTGVSKNVLCKIKVRLEGLTIQSMNVCYYGKIVIYPPKGVEIEPYTMNSLCDSLTKEFADYLEHYDKITESKLFVFPVDLYINHPDTKDKHLCEYFKNNGVMVMEADSKYITLKTSNPDHTKLVLSLMYIDACNYMLEAYGQGL